MDLTKFHQIRKETQEFGAELLVVSKNQPPEKITPLIEMGQFLFGESRVQEANHKWASIKLIHPNIRLDLIGHLQTNKAKEAVILFNRIQSLDSLKLARELYKWEERLGLKREYFLQINIGNEPQKSGIIPDDIPDFLNHNPLNITGLMCIPPQNEASEKFFTQMKELQLRFMLKNLSMGMSGDYKAALKCGTTMVRIGSSIFTA